MASKSDILNNLREYSSEQIAEAIKAGTVTMYELSKSGNLTPLMRRRIEDKLSANSSKNAQVASDVYQPSHEEISSSNEEDSSVDVLSSDLEEDVIIPEVTNIDASPEIAIAPSAVTTATAPPTFEAESVSSSNVKPSDEISNKGMFKRPFSFNGRIRRTEYWISFIIFFVWNLITDIMMKTPDPSLGSSLFVLISFIPMFWFLLAQNTKRCHDRGNSGWYQLIPFYALILLFGEGDKGNNEYGNNPKE